MPTIDENLRSLPIRNPMSCRNFSAATFGDVIANDPTLLVFLRHFG